MAAPVNGTVTNCLNSAACTFTFNTSAGTGWANTTNGRMSFQLPGEAKASYNLSYSAYIEKLTGTYTYWTIGNFYGTDVNTGNVVYGTTNTNFTITAHCSRGCSYTYTTDNGTVVFKFTRAELTSTSVSCSPSSFYVAGKTTCTITVANLWNSSNVPTGKIHLSAPGLGTFTNHGTCNLTAGSCTLKWHPLDNTNGYVNIAAKYNGNFAFYPSTGSTTVTVNGGG
ncbi:MAG: hypothetical protein L3K01_02805 [Thermoplasmata archaeon]|nr:hypothetical protein [Thermoplasmata archaeon]